MNKNLQSDDAILDSGATRFCSKMRCDFSSVSGRKDVKIGTADGTIFGHSGILRPNNLGISEGIFIPDLPVARLVSVPQLMTDGWRILFDERCGSAIYRNKEKVEIFTSPMALPRIELNFDLQNLFYTPTEEELQSTTTTTTNAEEQENESLPRRPKDLSRLLEHQRMGHLRPLKGCAACAVSRGHKKPFLKQRPEALNHNVLQQLNTDFWGPISPSSYFNMTLVLVTVCDASGYVWTKTLRHRNDAIEELRKLVLEIRAENSRFLNEGIVTLLRSDNDTVFRSAALAEVANSLGLRLQTSPPYSPSANGVVERFMRTLSGGLRSILQETDKRLWCRAVGHLTQAYNNTRRKYDRAPEFNDLTPSQVLKARGNPKLLELFKKRINEGNFDVGMSSRMRRFGCLAIVKRHDKMGKLDPKNIWGVYLGWKKNVHLVGVWVKDSRVEEGIRFVSFDIFIFVSNSMLTLC